MLNDLEARRAAARAMGGAARLDKLRASGKLPVRERLDLLLDPGSFREFGLLARSPLPEFADRTPADGVVAGWGRIDGRPVYVIADDPSVLAGTRGRTADEKLRRLRELVLREPAPLIMLNEAGAARVQECRGAVAAGLGEGFEQHMLLNGRVPQIAVHMGASFGGPSFVGTMCDFTVLVRGTGFMGMSGPPVVKVGIGVDHSAEEIGGAAMAMNATGQVHYVADDEAEALRMVRRYLSYLPTNCEHLPPTAPAALPADGPPPSALVPDNQRRGYDMRRLVRALVDADSVFELQPDYGRSLLTVFARLGGEPVGIVANNPGVRAGVLDAASAIKARRFVDTCDAFHVPLVFLCDTPGFLVGPEVEKERMVSLCGRLMTSLMSARVPRIQVVLRKAIGMAYIAMCGRACRPNAIVAWPTAVFDVMGPEAGVTLAHGAEIAAAADPVRHREALLAEFHAAASPYEAAGMALIDDVIAPDETRSFLLDLLARSRSSRATGFRHRIDP